jgi:hypothetical protein
MDPPNIAPFCRKNSIRDMTQQQTIRTFLSVHPRIRGEKKTSISTKYHSDIQDLQCSNIIRTMPSSEQSLLVSLPPPSIVPQFIYRERAASAHLPHTGAAGTGLECKHS